ncbi:hypothetical protein Pan44_24350 [Caulifigura coniformis]|uniref:Uncharacterized protein n=1 Tax=Caulifigura coniformis TaxID=2527983 RepID=A0A517SE44_9PLAN|nr:hypothetical protein [Caulifigura coniformis]QDT54402.1 hypothetical protein Pan44_24350 [Caulifigura coniformis]
MKNTIAVYSSKPAVKGADFIEKAREVGVELRFLALGGFIPHDPELGKRLHEVRGGASLLVGAFETDASILAEFDKLVADGERESVVTLLNAGQLPWCELYVGKFDYEATVKKKPKDKAGIDESVSARDLPALKAARTRYIVDNQSRKKNGGLLVNAVAKLLATESEGVIADYLRPSR